MLMMLQLYYLGVSVALFAYAMYTPRCALRAFVLGIGTNVFPLAFVHYMDMDLARLGGLPLAYLPGTAVGIALALRNGLRLPRRHLTLYVLICIYLIYTLCNTVLLRGVSLTNLTYWTAWPLNFLLFIAMAASVARLPQDFINRILEGLVLVLVAGSAVGLARFAAGFEPDANFMPMVNRNGTVVLIAFLFPLVFHVHAAQRKSRIWLLTCAGIIAVCVLLTFSRSGLLGLLAGTVLYYGRLSLMGLIKFSAAVLVIILVLSSGVAERTTERLLKTGLTITAMLEGREVDRSIGDHNRVILVNSAIANGKEHFWFGTGLGMENYRQGLRRAGTPPVTSKAHNFYLSYFAELGLVGFVLLLAILQRIYASLPPLNSRHRAFRASFLVTALMMTMNEYILLPELWLFMGLLAGISHQLASQAHLAKVHRPVRVTAPTPHPGAHPQPVSNKHLSRALHLDLGGNHG